MRDRKESEEEINQNIERKSERMRERGKCKKQVKESDGDIER